MAKVKGLAQTRNLIRSLPARFEEQVLRGAARSGANVIAADARERAESPLVKAGIVVRTSVREHAASARVTVKGRMARAVATWAEWGTDPHFIQVDEAQRGGRGVAEINASNRGTGARHALLINGQPVSGTVHHPGARPHPFLRPARDLRERDAIAAAQAYINKRLAGGKIIGTDEGDSE